MTPLRGAVAAVAVLACALPPAAGARRADCSNPRVGQSYAASVLGVLRSGRDVLGERLLRAPGGPTLARARAVLPPLLLARGPRGRPLTGSGVYYLPFADPPGPGGSASVNLHVADGGQIVARRVGGSSLRILVGARGAEAYGSCLGRLAPARLRGGWLPVLETSYADAAGARYAQESFATRLRGMLTSLVSLTVEARSDTLVRFAASSGGSVEALVPKGSRRVVYVAWTAAGARRLDRGAYAAALAAYTQRWRRRVAGGATVAVPERAVMDAARAVLVQDLLLGWRYSVGNPYEELSFPEAPDVAQVLGALGFADSSRAILEAALRRPPEPYANWKRGEKLYVYALHFRLFRDREAVRRATPELAAYVEALGRSLGRSGPPILERERFSSDIPDRVFGFHAQTVAWAGLRAMAGVWRELGETGLAVRSQQLASRLEAGLRRAVRASEQRLRDGSLFVPARLLDRERPYGSLVEERAGSYWNLVMPFGFATGFFPPGSAEARGVIEYLLRHGSRLLGLVRAGAYALYGRSEPFPVSGTDQVYGVNAARFLADNHRPDLLVLSLYGQLAAAMTAGTFVAGEGASVVPLDGRLYRAMYLPPNTAANAAFLETLRLMLVHETTDVNGDPSSLELAYSTPRAWLRSGRRVGVARMPTSFGRVSYTIRAGAHDVRIHLDPPRRQAPTRLTLRLRLPDGRRILRVTADGRSVRFDGASGTIDLTGTKRAADVRVATS